MDVSIWEQWENPGKSLLIKLVYNVRKSSKKYEKTRRIRVLCMRFQGGISLCSFDTVDVFSSDKLCIGLAL